MNRSHRTFAAATVAGIALLWLAVPAWAAHSDHGCRNCHAPHNAAPETADEYGVPLWSTLQTADGLPTYTLYDSKTFNATDIEQPDGPSKLCLGCHDGSYGSWMDADRVFVADELTAAHPVSFTYDTALATADTQLEDPGTALSGISTSGTIDDDLLDSKSKMQCTSCHDVHTSGKTAFLLHWDVPVATETVTDPDTGETSEEAIHVEDAQAMCRTCHQK